MQIFQPFIANKGLGEVGIALNDIDHVIDHPAFGPHHQIQIAQADIKIHHGDGLPVPGQRRAKRRGRCGFANAALAGGYNHHFGFVFVRHISSLHNFQLDEIVFEPGLNGPSVKVRIDVFR